MRVLARVEARGGGERPGLGFGGEVWFWGLGFGSGLGWFRLDWMGLGLCLTVNYSELRNISMKKRSCAYIFVCLYVCMYDGTGKAILIHLHSKHPPHNLFMYSRHDALVLALALREIHLSMWVSLSTSISHLLQPYPPRCLPNHIPISFASYEPVK